MIVTLARFVVSVGLLLLVSRFVDVGDVVVRLAELHAGWVVLGLAISVLQVVALAWRWVYTARRLGLELPMGRAVSEYWLGVLVNQVLPGGISGDISRAWRQAGDDAPPREVVTAVFLERASAQVVMTGLAIVSLLALPWASIATRVAVGVVLAAVVWVLAPTRMRGSAGASGGRLGTDARKALLEGGALPVQLASATFVVASYLAVFIVAARAVGVETPLGTLLPLVAPVLMTMLIPVTVGGWGIREAAAATLWGLVGLTPADGAAISVAYGVLVLTSALPGVFALMRPPAGRDRRGRPSRA